MTWFAVRFAAAACAIVLMVGWIVPSLVGAPPRVPPEQPGDTQDGWATSAAATSELVAGHDARYWHTLAYQRLRRIQSLKATLVHTTTVSEALNLACTVYGNCATLWRRARCESHLYAYAHNSSGASGLLQFLPSTWRSTPYGRFSIYSPYANALAAGWMIGVAGRGGEWSCR